MPVGSDPTRAAVFFDRDNTLIKVGAGYVGDPKDVVLMTDAAEAVAAARHLRFATVVISNQSGVARGFFTEKDVKAVNCRLDEMLKSRDRRAVVDRHEFCPHHPAYGVAPYRQACQCRKPRDGMLRRAASALKLDLGRSWLIGDAPRDVEAGHSAGVRTILLSPTDVEPSPSASANARVRPDFRAHSLREALWIIARETGQQLPMMTAEEEELDELDDLTPGGDFDEEALSLAESHDDPVAGAEAGVAAPILAPPRPRVASRGTELPHEAPPPRRAFVELESLPTSPHEMPMDQPPPATPEPGEPVGLLRVMAVIVQAAALAIAAWASVPVFDQNRLLLAIFVQLVVLTLVSASSR